MEQHSSSSSSRQEMQEKVQIRSALALVKPKSAFIAQLIHQCSVATMHPLFAPARWPGLTSIQFIYIAPALFLASRIVTCRKSLNFFHAFLFGGHSLTMDHFWRIHPDDHNHPLPPQEKVKVETVLIQLASLVTIVFTTMDRGCNDAQTRPDGPIRRNSGIFRNGIHSPGTKSIIELPTSFLTEIDLATLSPDALMRRWFVDGMALAHESCHCLCNATLGPEVEELRFENDDFRELGYAFEKEVAGGAVAIDRKGTRDEVLNLKTIPVYEMRALANRTGRVPEELKSRVLETIHGEKLRSMFEQKFWDE